MMFGDKVGKDKPVKLVKELRQVAARNRLLPRRSQPGVDQHHRQRDPGDGRARHADDADACARATSTIRVEICDDGPGIPEEIVDRIFTPFFTTKPFGEGTGLGLDLAWRIVVEKHHGNLRVESKPGDTRFIIVLPLVAPAREAAIADGMHATGPTTPQRHRLQSADRHGIVADDAAS